ncbi:hypothetical protein CLV63_101166 [Murinocardiopsis flavida]|uniref:DUF4034 domain-containing protein n=1 Tax=Murinocardiopsis flavida TaxID=645275 RepID=A0A2P8DU18_9ACTN|nr:hypothetical protein [Murinocardiopsis flavida]PSL00692.1 hypothetical protein CLV63_101166 [Murinocardiopsis flavida]
MGLFGRRKGEPAPLPAFITGRHWGDPALDAAEEAVGDGHLLAGLALLREARHDFERRDTMVSAFGHAAIGHSGSIYDLLEDGMPAEDAADILVWLGSTLIAEAWEIRGGGFADTVSDNSYKLFRATLANAEEPLLTAARLRPDDPVPWSEMLSYCMGTGADQAERDSVWQNVLSRYPTLWSANWTRLQTLCAKWHGSHEEMFAFARGAVAGAPPGDPVVAMLVEAHSEYLFREREALVENGGFAAFMKFEMGYFTPQVVAELEAAAAKWCQAPRPHPREVDSHHLFGWIFHEAERADNARWHLGQTHMHFRSRPWNYHGTEDTSKEELAKAMRELKML